MSRILVLIDLQEDYVSPKDKGVIDYVEEMIGYYEANNLPIICLTLDDPLGHTIIRPIKKALSTARVMYMDKGRPSGAKLIEKAIGFLGYDPRHTVANVVGAYTEHCVFSTVVHLSEGDIKKVRVHRHGVISEEDDIGQRRLKHLDDYPKVKVV
jgi:nicotinamidase-related amidase